MEENPSAKKHLINVLDYLLDIDTGLTTEERNNNQEDFMKSMERTREILRMKMRRLRIKDGKELT